MKTPLQILVEQGLARREIGPVAAALGEGLERNFISDIISGKKRSVRADMMGRLAAAIGQSTEEVAAVAARASSRVSTADNSPMPKAATKRSRPAPGLVLRGTASAAAARRHDGFVWTSRLEILPTPPALQGAVDLFGFYVSGRSMNPMHADGDLRIAMPGRPYKPGDSVVFTTRNWEGSDEEAFIKVFVERKGEKVVFWQLTPPARIEIPAAYIVDISRVLTTNELFGVPPGERFELPSEALLSAK